MIVEKPPASRENLTVVSGRDILTNEQVNILSASMIHHVYGVERAGGGPSRLVFAD